MEDNKKYGLLLNNSIKLNRQYFKEMVRLHGIYVIYRAPLPGKKWTTYAELDTNFGPPKLVGCLFHDHPDQKTLKKMGWVAELQESSSLIEVDYDLPGLQQGALFIVPSGLDNAQGRLFRVVSMSNIMVYPCSITCEITPEFEDTMSKTEINDFHDTDFNLISEEKDTQQFLSDNNDAFSLLEDNDDDFL